MIRKLTRLDHEYVFSFLQQDAALNLFIIGDIEAFGYNNDFQEIWGDFLNDGKLRAILLRYHQSFLPYAREHYDVEGFATIMSGVNHLQLSGKTDIVTSFESVPDLNLGKRKDTYFCEYRNDQHSHRTDYDSIKLATIQDVDRIISLRKQITEFNTTEQARTMLIQALQAHTGRTYYIERNGEIVACASTAAENSQSAMVVGVCTHPTFRGKGFASALVAKLIRDMTSVGKTLCLFYDNPVAGRIYKRLGFQDIGMWTMYV